MTNSSRPSFSQANLAGLEGLPTSEVHGLCLESILRQHLLHRERRRAVGSLLLLLRGVWLKPEGVMMTKLAKYPKTCQMRSASRQKVLSSFWKVLTFFSCQNSKFLEISFGRLKRLLHHTCNMVQYLPLSADVLRIYVLGSLQ